MQKLKNVLLIGDDETGNFLNKLFLEGLHYAENVHISCNGQEALDFILENREDMPGLIFLDINMPVMDGFEFLEEFSCLPSTLNSNIPIVMLTASERFHDYEKAKKYNVTGYLNKPLTEEKLEAILKEMVV